MSDTRRSTGLIFAAGAFASTGLFAAITVAPLLAEELSDSKRFVGLPVAAGTLGTAVGAVLLATIMSRRGRAVGLRLGYLVGVVGVLGAVLAVDNGSLPLFVAGMFVTGTGFAAYQLGRFAVADLYPPEQRAQAVGWTVWAATIGALAGPNLTKAVEPVAEALELTPHASGLLIAATGIVAAFVCVALVRARPPEREDTGQPATTGPIYTPAVRRAITAIVGAQVAMVGVMAITPVHVRDAGHDIGVVGAIMSAHFIGMFALAPLAGKLVARIGIARSITTGLALLITSAAVAGALDASRAPGVGIALFGLGFGWSISFVAASATLTRDVPVAARVRVQGVVDAVGWGSSALASTVGGLLLPDIGYGPLALTAGAIAAFALVAVAALSGRAAGVPAPP